MVFERQLFTLHFLQLITCGDVNYDYMPEMFVTWEEQRNNFTFDEE